MLSSKIVSSLYKGPLKTMTNKQKKVLSILKIQNDTYLKERQKHAIGTTLHLLVL